MLLLFFYAINSIKYGKKIFTKKGEKIRKEHGTDLSFEEVKKTGLYESVEAFSGYEIITLTSEEVNNCMGGGALYY